MKIIKSFKRWTAGIAGILLLGSVILGASGCSVKVKAEDLMDGIQPGSTVDKTTDDAFTQAYNNFSVRLFQETIEQKKNTLISPLSVMLALAMTANGADTQTLKEIEAVLGGGMPIEELNQYLYTYVKNLPSEKTAKFQIANSIWFRDDVNRIQVKKDFLQTNADYYRASAYKAPFDQQTVKDINNWVKDKTDGLIKNVLDEIDHDTLMYLINALVFDAEWEEVYRKNDVGDGIFTALNGEKRNVEIMRSKESCYLDDGQATGFVKDYKGRRYSFAALLPNEGIAVEDYIASLSGVGLAKTIREAKEECVDVQMPKFSYDYEVKMNDTLQSLGIVHAFDKSAADFSRIGSSGDGNLYIGGVLHKTYISVDEKGTQAGAATVVSISGESAMIGHSVKLDRPFVYLIMDNATGLPLFIGSVLDID